MHGDSLGLCNVLVIVITITITTTVAIGITIARVILSIIATETCAFSQSNARDPALRAGPRAGLARFGNGM